MLNGLDLFSGIGGLTVALGEWVRPIAYCERDRYCQGVLLSRMSHQQIANAPIWDDVTTLRACGFSEEIDIIYGGFPCQDISVAGHGSGLAGKRSGLFFEVIRLVDEIRPTFCFLENVPAITSRGLGEVTAAFTRLRYDCRWGIISAQAVGAPHIRKRWFLLAHAERSGNREKSAAIQDIRREASQWANETVSFGSGSAGVADSNGERLEIGKQRKSEQFTPVVRASWWATEPDVGRVANGVPHRVDKIRGLGNAVVPLQAQTAFKMLMGLS